MSFSLASLPVLARLLLLRWPMKYNLQLHICYQDVKPVLLLSIYCAKRLICDTSTRSVTILCQASRFFVYRQIARCLHKHQIWAQLERIKSHEPTCVPVTAKNRSDLVVVGTQRMVLVACTAGDHRPFWKHLLKKSVLLLFHWCNVKSNFLWRVIWETASDLGHHQAKSLCESISKEQDGLTQGTQWVVNEM